MSRKNKKNREFDRLQNLYQPASNTSSTIESIESETKSEEASEFLASTKYATKHITIKQDLIFLSVLIVIMVALLFTLNYFVATTNFGTWLSNLIGGII